MRTYTKNNVVHIDPDLGPGEVMVYIGSPSHTVCPYDTYARMIAKHARIAFMRGGVDAKVHVCHRRIAHVGYGSGRAGAVRTGDDMIPPDIHAVVNFDQEDRAIQVWNTYSRRRLIEKPNSVYTDRWYDQPNRRWTAGGAWSRVVVNAIAIAKTLGRETAKLEAYQLKHQPLCSHPTT